MNQDKKQSVAHATAKSASLTRRSFLKTTAAAGAAVALSGSVASIALAEQESNPATAQDTIVKSCCRPGCVTGCMLDIYVRDGKVVKTRPAEMPDDVYTRACQRGLSHVQTIYSPDRIQYPMKRVGERGAGEWERISWDEAINEITAKIKEVAAEYGPRAIGLSYNGGQVACLNGASGAPRRFFNVFGGTIIDNCVDWGNWPGMVRVFGKGGLYGMAAEARELEHADVFVLWGCNLTVSNWDRWQHMMRAIDKGAELIVIDPEYTAIASKSDQFIGLRPGSDGALIMGMIDMLIKEELYDRDFVLRASVAPFLVRKDNGKFLRGSDLGIEPAENGVDATTGKTLYKDEYVVWDEAANEAMILSEATSPALRGSFTAAGVSVNTAFDLLAERASQFPIEKIAPICELEEETIRELTRTYASGKTVCGFLGFGTNSYDNGTYMGHAYVTLHVLTGNIGKIGTNAAYHQNSPNPSASLYNTMYMFPEMMGLTNPSLPLLYLPKLQQGQTEFNGTEFTPLKVLISGEVNLYNNYLNCATWDEVVFPSLDMYVVIDRIMSDSAAHADYVLPAAHWFELEDIRPDQGSTPYTVYCDKAIDPLYESKPDWEIFSLLAKSLDLGKYFDGEYMEHLKMAYEGTGRPTAEELKDMTAWRSKGDPLSQPYDIDAGNIMTASGRFEFYCETPLDRNSKPLPKDLFQDNCLPTFKEPLESWSDNPKSEQYPLQLISQRNRTLVHSQYPDVKWLREVDPEPTVYLNTADAEVRGLTNADYVRVYNDRGEAVVRLVVSDGMRPGTLMYPKGWLGKYYKKGNMHSLTNIEYNPVSINHSYQESLVEVEKWEEE